MRRMKAKTILLGMLAAAFFCFPAYAEKLDTSKPVPTGLSLSEDGSADWDDVAEAKKYTVVLERLKNGSSWSTVQTRTTTDAGYDFSVGSTGYYKIKVRAHFYDDTYSSYAEMANSEKVLIDEDNTGSGGPDGWYSYSPGPGVVSGTSGTTTTTWGPDGSTTTTTTTTTYSTNMPGYNGSTTGTSAGTGSATASGWVQSANGWWYRYTNGSYPSNGWASINNKWYFFNSEGYLQTGWIYWNNCWYLALPDGQMATGWRNVNDRWYYLNESGIMLTGYQLIDGKTYYLDATGARVQNGYSPDGHLFDANGVMIS